MQQTFIIQNDDFDNIDYVSNTPDIHREIHIEYDELAF